MKGFKNPSAPKPPLNPYLEFSGEERPRILEELGNLSATEVAKEVGIRWKNLAREEKKKYEDRFHENREKYRIEKDNFEDATKTLAAPAITQKKRKKKDPKAPKRPLSPFMEFCKEERSKIIADLGKISIGDMGKELGRRWGRLSNEEKQPFEARSTSNQLSYRKTKADQIVAASVSSGIRPSDFTSTATSACPPTSSVASPPNSTSSQNIQLSDLGFAQQGKFPWHPALKTGLLARGSRVLVTFLGTGQSGIVDKSRWLLYSQKAEDKIATKALMKIYAFRQGLEQLKDLRTKLSSDQPSPINVQGVLFTPQVGGRKFRSLNKDHLQKEEESNRIQMDKKMRQEEGTLMWTCRDCNWRGKFSHKAKAHARDCGQRRKTSSKKSKEKKFPCSKEGCGLSFSLRSQLASHYR